MPAPAKQGEAIVHSLGHPRTRRGRLLALAGLGRRAALKVGNQSVEVGKGTLPIPRRQGSREIKHERLP